MIILFIIYILTCWSRTNIVSLISHFNKFGIFVNI